MSSVGRDSFVGTETRWGRNLPLLSIPPLGLTQPHVQLVPGPFSGAEEAGA
jgi:hypothetical protein